MPEHLRWTCSGSDENLIHEDECHERGCCYDKDGKTKCYSKGLYLGLNTPVFYYNILQGLSTPVFYYNILQGLSTPVFYYNVLQGLSAPVFYYNILQGLSTPVFYLDLS